MVSSGINIAGGGFAVLASQAINKTKRIKDLFID